MKSLVLEGRQRSRTNGEKPKGTMSCKKRFNNNVITMIFKGNCRESSKNQRQEQLKKGQLFAIRIAHVEEAKESTKGWMMDGGLR